MKITLSNGQEVDAMLVPVPQVAPLGWEIDDPKLVQEVWDTFVKPGQDAGEPQSGEMRMLMAVLRSMYAGLEVKGK